jgi:hypothetical protein
MQPIASPELLFGILLISFFSCLCFLLSGGVILALIGSLTRMQLKFPDRFDLAVLIRRGYYMTLACFAFAFFFAARLALAVQYNMDFAANHRLLYDGCIAGFAFMAAAYIFSVYNVLKPEDS